MGRSVTARVFRTRRAIITLTDTTLIYEQKRNPPMMVSVARADITEVACHLCVLVRPCLEKLVVHHRGGVLTIPRIGRRTAERLQKALSSQ